MHKGGFTKLNEISGKLKKNEEFEISNEKHIVKCLKYL